MSSVPSNPVPFMSPVPPTVLPGSPLPHLLSTVLKQVQYGIEGTPVITLFRLFYAYYSTYPHSVANSDELRKSVCVITSISSDMYVCILPLSVCLSVCLSICPSVHRMVVKVIKDYPKFIPHTIDFITAIQRSFPDRRVSLRLPSPPLPNSTPLPLSPLSPLPLQLLADYLQYLSTSSLPSLLPHLPLYLLFVKQAAMHSSITPLVSCAALILCCSGSSNPSSLPSSLFLIPRANLTTTVTVKNTKPYSA